VNYINAKIIVKKYNRTKLFYLSGFSYYLLPDKVYHKAVNGGVTIFTIQIYRYGATVSRSGNYYLVVFEVVEDMAVLYRGESVQVFHWGQY